MPPTTRKAQPAAPADPLADLRAPEPATSPAPGLTAPAEGEGTQGPPSGPESGAEPVRDALWHESAVASIVADWHGDPTASSFGHGGGTCACRYLAERALKAVHGEPVQVDDTDG